MDQKPKPKSKPKSKHRILKSTSVVAGMTLLSRVLGFMRDIVFAQIFGASAAFDAYVVATKIPNFLRRLFAEGAFSQAFVPILAEYKEVRSAKDVREFISRIAGCLGLALLVITLLAQVIAPLIIMVFAPGFLRDPLRFPYATHMLHITFPYLFFIGMTAFSGAILNTYGRFSIPAFTPALLNVALIAVSLFWAPHAQVPVFALAWGVFFGGLLQLGIQIPALLKLNLLPIPKWGWKDPGVRRVIKLMVPALFGVSVAQVGLLIDNFFASFLPHGSISWLYYSDRLVYFPTGVVGVAIATVVLPYLSRHSSNKDEARYSETLDWALRCVVLVGLPCAVGMFITAGPIISTLIHHGEFTTHDLIMTRKSLMAFSIGLPGFMLVKVLAAGFYSKQNIKTPVKIAVVATAINVILNLALIHHLAHAGLALATSIASLFNAVALLVMLIRQKIFIPSKNWWRILLQVVIANVVMGVVVYYFAGGLQRWIQWDVLSRVLHLVPLLIVAFISYVLTLLLLGLRPRHFKPPL